MKRKVAFLLTLLISFTSFARSVERPIGWASRTTHYGGISDIKGVEDGSTIVL